MTMREIIRSISRQEWKFVGLSALAAMIITAIPVAVGIWAASKHGLVWSGRQVFGPGDFSVYLSLIQQAKDGRLLFDNLFTPEYSRPVLNIFWLSVGWLAKLVRASPLVAYHLSRTLLIPVLAATAYVAIAYFIRPIKERIAALMLFMFGSGLGMYYAAVIPQPASSPGLYQWPIDLWVAEAHAFTSMLYSPHFIASWVLLIWAILLVANAVEQASFKYTLAAGMVGALLLQFHPYHVPTLMTVATGIAVARLWQLRRLELKVILAAIIFITLLIPPIAYHYAFALADGYGRYFSFSNLTLTPSLGYVLLGFGAVSILWIFGRSVSADDRSGYFRRQVLYVWAATHLLLAYAPFNFQRRLLEGLDFPLVILAIPPIFALTDWLRRKHGSGSVVIVAIAAIAVFMFSNFSAVGRNVVMYVQNYPPLTFMRPGEAAAYDWLAANTSYEPTSVLVGPEHGNRIVGYANRRVFMGQWSQTIDPAQKMRLARLFYGGKMTDTESVDLLREYGLTHVFVGREETRLGGASLAGKMFLRQVFANDDAVIYEVSPEAIGVSAE